MSRLFEATLIENQEVAKGHFVVTLKAVKAAPRPRAGQFFMLGLNTGSDPLLKRPFSLYRTTSEGFVQILYRVKGKGTRLMSSLKSGSVLKVLGPLGNGFPLPAAGKQPVLVGGGLGIVPLVALAESIKQNSPRVFVGARNKDEILAQDVLSEVLSKTGAHMEIATDDGSHGRRGLVTDMLEDFFGSSAVPLSSYVLYGCGPRPMLKSLSDIAVRLGIEGYVSLEEHMACGVGACMGCVVKTPAGYRRVCKEGPVFPINEVLLAP